jgi:hypothetical protein
VLQLGVVGPTDLEARPSYVKTSSVTPLSKVRPAIIEWTP